MECLKVPKKQYRKLFGFAEVIGDIPEAAENYLT